MSVLITGGTGFIGAKVAALLVGRGQEVVCFDLLPDPERVAHLGHRVRVVRGDVTYFSDLLATIKEHRVEKIVHLAYVKTSQAERAFHLATRVNVLGTDNIYEASRLMGVSRVVISSSIGANGMQASYGERPVREEEPGHPVSSYGAMKGFNEFMGRKYAELYGISFAALRITFAYGHGLESLPTWPSDYATFPAMGKPIHLPCAADQMYNLVYVDDVAEALVRLCLAERLNHHVYFSGGETASVGDLVNVVREYIPEADISFSEKPQYLAHQYIYRVDATRLREDVGLVARPLREGVLDHINEVRAMAGLEPIRR
ncbi:MAG: NAD-dependent epimerase/dehydratase family protein [Chloroflexota bacterium]